LSNGDALGMTAPRMDDASQARTPGASGVRLHPHAAFFNGAASYTAFVALVVTLLIRHNDLPSWTEWRFVAYGVVAALAGWIGPAFRWRASWVELDDRRLRWSVGLLRRRRLDSELDRLQALVVEQGSLGQWLGYGTLRAVDEAGVEHAFPAVGHVSEFRAAATRALSARRARAGSRRAR
jgi:membrane protein YdbS with pleckstrin-like domain